MARSTWVTGFGFDAFKPAKGQLAGKNAELSDLPPPRILGLSELIPNLTLQCRQNGQASSYCSGRKRIMRIRYFSNWWCTAMQNSKGVQVTESEIWGIPNPEKGERQKHGAILNASF